MTSPPYRGPNRRKSSRIAMVKWHAAHGYSRRGNFWGSGFSLCVMAERYILEQKCLKKWIPSYEHDGGTFNPLHRPWAPQYTSSQTDRRQQYDCVQQYDRLKTTGSRPSCRSRAHLVDNGVDSVGLGLCTAVAGWLLSVLILGTDKPSLDGITQRQPLACLKVDKHARRLVDDSPPSSLQWQTNAEFIERLHTNSIYIFVHWRT